MARFLPASSAGGTISAASPNGRRSLPDSLRDLALPPWAVAAEHPPPLARERHVGYGMFAPMLTMIAVLSWCGIVIPALLNPSVLHLGRSPHSEIFVGLYLVGFLMARASFRAPRTGKGAVGAVIMSVCGLGATAVSSPESLTPVLTCVTAAVIGFALPRVWVWVVLALQMLGYVHGVVFDYMTGQWAVVLGAMCIFAAMVVEVAVREFYDRVRLASTTAALETANRSLEDAQARLAQETRDAERLRISRDLHDAVGHRLTALALRLEVAAHLTSGEAATHVAEARDLARATLHDVRAVVSQLRESRLDLRASLELLAASTAIDEVVVEVDQQAPEWPPTHLETAFRVVQESLTNAARHSGASRVEVRVVCHPDDHLEVRIADNGCGPGQLAPGNGLTGMAERLAQLGGSLDCHRGPDGGFVVDARMPCPKGLGSRPQPSDQ